MTDINEIIGRALLTLNGKGYADNKGTLDPAFVIDGYGGAGHLFVKGCWDAADIGAAVVTALSDAGFKIEKEGK